MSQGCLGYLLIVLKPQPQCLPHWVMRSLNLCLLQYLYLRDVSRPVHLQIMQNIRYIAYPMEVTKTEGWHVCAFPLLKGRNKQLEKMYSQLVHLVEGVEEIIWIPILTSYHPISHKPPSHPGSGLSCGTSLLASSSWRGVGTGVLTQGFTLARHLLLATRVLLFLFCHQKADLLMLPARRWSAEELEVPITWDRSEWVDGPLIKATSNHWRSLSHRSKTVWFLHTEFSCCLFVNSVDKVDICSMSKWARTSC
jgi:hypothetical protein